MNLIWIDVLAELMFFIKFPIIFPSVHNLFLLTEKTPSPLSDLGNRVNRMKKKQKKISNFNFVNTLWPKRTVKIDKHTFSLNPELERVIEGKKGAESAIKLVVLSAFYWLFDF